MAEALQTMLAYGFSTLKLHRIEALVVPGNERSVRVLEKLGFQEEGVLRGYGFWNDKFWDLRCFSLLAGDETAWRTE
jgi:ribosomal-protein-alanine N-acetyltransferase